MLPTRELRALKWTRKDEAVLVAIADCEWVIPALAKRTNVCNELFRRLVEPDETRRCGKKRVAKIPRFTHLFRVPGHEARLREWSDKSGTKRCKSKPTRLPFRAAKH